MSATELFRRARDFLIQHRLDYATAVRDFEWPRLERFNWALDWFDVLAEGNARLALHLVEDDGREVKLSYLKLSERSSRLAGYLNRSGVARGDRVLLMLGNSVELWETMLAAMKLGAPVVPATTLLTPEDLADRIERGRIGHVVTDAAGAAKLAAVPGAPSRFVVGGAAPAGWRSLDEAFAGHSPVPFVPRGETRGDDPMLLYFTSGTTAKPKLVIHTHTSYPVGHLSTMYWVGLQAGDVHLNISSPGWAKHAWSSFFAPFNAGATIFVSNYARFNAARLLEQLVRHRVTTLCAPPTVWRMLILEDLAKHPVALREALSAGEPLNPEVIERVKVAWGVTIRDGYGQTETTAQIGNTPGQPLKAGSMGRPLPGYRVALLDPEGHPGTEGEISIALSPRPVGLMAGYEGDAALNQQVTRYGHYHTGDVAAVDADGYITYVGRGDDVFKSSDYRISPFELESALIEHPAVAEAAIIPSPDDVRGLVPKAFVVVRPGFTPSRELALELFGFFRQRLAPYKRVRRLEFAELPKTISGKIRRVELRKREQARGSAGAHGPLEFWQDDFPELKDRG